jgi:hypothetical protein
VIFVPASRLPQAIQAAEGGGADIAILDHRAPFGRGRPCRRRSS